MFIAQVTSKNAFAPEERNVSAKPNISLRWSFRGVLESRFYKHFVPLGLKTERSIF